VNCLNCGAPIPAGVVQCSRCGASIASNPAPAQFGGAGPIQVIVNTGAVPGVTPTPVLAPSEPIKSKMVAGLLGIFLGSLGIHRFYLGYTGIGLAQLLITVMTCGWGGLVTGIWGLVEGIMILTGSINKDALGRPLKD
jgi:TM2 domain-containing membrane protein YozV